MKVVKLFNLLLLSAITIVSCSKETDIADRSNELIQYNGRIDFSDESRALLTWAGSSVKIKFKGAGAKVLLQTKYSPCALDIVIDGDSMFVLEADSVKKWFVLASNLQDSEHSIEVFKRTNNGDLWFYGFQLDVNAELLKQKKQKKIIEFIGDSITQGSSINDTINDEWRGLNSDNYFTYAAVTARHYDAQYYCVAQGGVGLMVGGNTLTGDDLFRRINIRDADSQWDYTKVQPDIVVINLFENDCCIFKNMNHPHFIKTFGNKKPSDEYIISAYVKFVQSIRSNYPNTKIICSLGSMSAVKEGSPWPGYVQRAVEKVNREDVYFCLFPYKNSSGHPEVKDHKIMANTLISFIEKNNIW